jgi:hypothetical protein
VSRSEPNDVARIRDALASLASDARGAVDAERIFDALHGDLSAGERRQVVDELVVNAAAAEAWRLGRELTPERVSVAPSAGDRWRWMSIAAATVLAVGLAWQFLEPWGPTEEPAYRSVEQQTITSSLPSGATLARTQPVLRWSGVAGVRDRVRVLTTELTLLEETGELTDPEYTLPPDVLRRIPSRGVILWQIERRGPGSAVIVSPTFSVRVE